MNHNIKIEKKYLLRILSGEKAFEVRKNDRDYQVGDSLTFSPVENGISCLVEGYDWKPFLIKHIHIGLGMEKDFVVLGL